MNINKYLFVVVSVVMLVLTSCRKEQQVNPPVDVPEGSFLATISNEANPQKAPKAKGNMSPMTTIDGNSYVIWEEGDSIYINGKLYTTSTGGNSVIFSPANADDPAVGTEFVAFYGVENPANGAASGVLPTTQIYEDGKVSNLPMYAACGSDHVLTFHNICAALHITVPVACSKVKLTASESLSGDFTMSVDNGKPVASMSDEDNKYVEIEKRSGTFAADETIYLAVPQGSYTNAQIMFIDNNSVIIESKEIGSFTTQANMIYKVSVTPYPELCFTALEETTIGMVRVKPSGSSNKHNVKLQFCTYKPNATAGNRLGSWTDFVTSDYSSSVKVKLSKGEKIYIRATSTNAALATSSSDYWKFTSTGNVTVSGNIMYLLNDSNPATDLTSSVNDYAFSGLFYGMESLVDASGLILPATTLSTGCYFNMFNGCTNLKEAPKLSATTLSKECYYNMFYGCTNLTAAPELSATTLSDHCYTGMFTNCSSLVSAPALPATTLDSNCYCNMFTGCSNLAIAPELPAPILESNCYNQMFSSCSRLSSVTMKATNVNADGCLNSWLKQAGTSVPDGSRILYVDASMVSNGVITLNKGNFTIQAYNANAH